MNGGSELACMSTSEDIDVIAGYARSNHPLAGVVFQPGGPMGAGGYRLRLRVCDVCRCTQDATMRRLALEAAADQAKGAVLASDGFFPFDDTVRLAASFATSVLPSADRLSPHIHRNHQIKKNTMNKHAQVG